MKCVVFCQKLTIFVTSICQYLSMYGTAYVPTYYTVHVYIYIYVYKYIYIYISAGPSLEGATRLRRSSPVKQFNSYLPES